MATADMEKQVENARVDPSLWSVITAEPGVGVVIMSVEGEMLFVNEQALGMFFGDDSPSPEDVIGRMIHELHEPAFVRERLTLYQRVVREQRPLIIRHIRLGRQINSTIWPTPNEPDSSEPAQVLIIMRAGEIVDPVGHDIDVVESDFADLGDLDVLTTRELEVLALLGTGMTIAAAAGVLHRSPKTIEKHRDAIARKLQTRNRVELARIAATAGLQLSDARRPRVR